MGENGEKGPERDGTKRDGARSGAGDTALPAGHLLGRLVAQWSKTRLAGMALGAELLAEGRKVQRGAQSQWGSCLGAGSQRRCRGGHGPQREG